MVKVYGYHEMHSKPQFPDRMGSPLTYWSEYFDVVRKSDYDLLQAKLDKAVAALKRLSKSGDGTHSSKHASFYDCLPTLQIEFSERLDFARETIAEIGKG